VRYPLKAASGRHGAEEEYPYGEQNPIIGCNGKIFYGGPSSLPSSAGITRIRFKGYNLRLSTTPVIYNLPFMGSTVNMKDIARRVPFHDSL
jgi:hypothetical protein